MKRFIIKLKIFVSWLKIIWKDNNYDFTSLYDVLIFKTKILGEGLERYNSLETSKHNAKRLKLVSNILQRLRDEYYTSEPYEYYDIDVETNDRSVLNISYSNMNLEPYFNKYKRLYNELKNNYDDDVELAKYMGYYNHKRAKKLVFNIMENNIEDWWD